MKRLGGMSLWQRGATCLALLSLLGSPTACAERTGAGTPPAHSTAQPSGSAEAAQPEPAADVVPPIEKDALTWRVAARMERWEEVARQVDLLPVEERREPKMRFLRARAGIEVGDHARAVELLEGLEKELPLLTYEIRQDWARAAAEVGPHEEAAEYFAKSGRAMDLVRAARALEKGGDDKAALNMSGRAIKAAQRAKKRSLEAAARGVRARIKLAGGKVAEAVPDLQWLAEKAPTTPEGRDAVASLDEHGKRLRGKRQLESINAMIAGGHPEMALVAVEKLSGVSAAEKLHAVAWATYRARKYPEAALAFEKASKVRSGRTAEQLYYWARALARAGRDGEAIAKHAQVVKRFRKGLWAERASYQKARLHLLNGQFADAVKAYTTYLSQFPRGQSAADARYDLALAELSAGQAKKAQKTFAALAAKAKKRQVGTLRQLEGVAALRAGDEARAVQIWKDVNRNQPLTWGAMMARARLASIGVKEVPVMPPASGGGGAAPIKLALPPKAALLLSIGLDGDAERVLAKSEQIAAERYVGRESEALCEMYGLMSPARRQFRVGSAALSFDSLMRAPSPAERWGWECIYPRPYGTTVASLQQKHSIPSGLVYAVMRQESAFKPEVVSPVGAAGLMQLMPNTARLAAKEASIEYDESHIHRPELNLSLGAFYLGKLLRTFEGSVPLAVASYNAGPTAVSHWLEAGADRDADLWVARIPYHETRKYVGRVVGNFVRYQWLEGGSEAVSDIPLQLPEGARAEPDAY